METYQSPEMEKISFEQKDAELPVKLTADQLKEVSGGAMNCTMNVTMNVTQGMANCTVGMANCTLGMANARINVTRQ